MFDASSSLMTDVEVAQLLCVSVRQLRTMAEAGAIPYVDLEAGDGTIRFRADDVATFVAGHRVPLPLDFHPMPMM